MRRHVRKQRGRQTEIRTFRVMELNSSNIRACPKVSLMPAHYRPDGSCLCNVEPERRQKALELRRQARELYRQARELEEGL